MKDTELLQQRDYYFNKLLSYKDTEPIKVITGFRRSGKSSLLKVFRRYLLQSGVYNDQIIYISFEILTYRQMNYLEVYDYVKKQLIPGKKMYLIFDEIQVIEHWEETVNSLHTETDADIYISGSNAKLLSSDLSTYLSGRYVEISILPLSFSEYIRFHGYNLEEYITPLGEKKQRIKNEQGEEISVQDFLNAYLTLGGMPGTIEFGFDQDQIWTLLDGIYNTAVVRDILEHENQKKNGERKVTDPALLRKITEFMADSIGSTISINNIANTFVSNKELTDRSRQGSPAVATVQAYVNALKECYLFYPVSRYDVKGKELLKTQKKYYIVDTGIRNYLLGYKNTDRGHIIENAVFLELIRRGWQVSIGKVYNMKIDFIIERRQEKEYLQVTASLDSPEFMERELRPLRAVKDNFPKAIITENPRMFMTEDGIKVIGLTDFLLNESSILF